MKGLIGRALYFLKVLSYFCILFPLANLLIYVLLVRAGVCAHGHGATSWFKCEPNYLTFFGNFVEVWVILAVVTKLAFVIVPLSIAGLVLIVFDIVRILTKVVKNFG